MMLTMMILMMSSIAFTLPMAMNPLTLGMMVLLLSLMLAITFSISMSSWVSFLIFLIYISGMLVMFAYFVAIIPNQNISVMYVISIMYTMLIMLLIMTKMLMMSPSINMAQIQQMNIMYTKMNIPILLILAMILLFTMIVVVKITIHNKGPLRPFNYV